MHDDAQRDAVQRYVEGTLSGEMAVMYCLEAVPDVDALRAALDAATVECAGRAPALARSLDALADLVLRNRAGCERIARMLASGVDSDRPAESVEHGIAFCRRLFDWSVAQSSESSVALYSLGNPAILEAATREVVELLVARGWVTSAREVLEIGCGIGRFEQALSPHVRSITGIDVSPRMIEEARQRSAELGNVSLLACTGHDLAPFADASFDLVMAVDSFPYLVQSGMALVERHFEEARRVLRPGGDLVIFEFSYRGDLGRDRDDVSRLAGAHDFTVRDNGTRALSLWDGVLFHLTSHLRPEPSNPK
ncbi:MAG: methyltransferase domain-containing protein [Betaproteobacteria bacterium]